MSRKLFSVAFTSVIATFTLLQFSAFAQSKLKKVEDDIFLPPLVGPAEPQKGSEKPGVADLNEFLVKPSVPHLVKPLIQPRVQVYKPNTLPNPLIDEIFDLKDPSSVFSTQDKKLPPVPKEKPSENTSGGYLGSDNCCSDAFSSFIEPVTNPIWFMDPRIRSRVRAVFINQMFPEDSILQGGDMQVYAVQISLALSDRVSFIANKDGYSTIQADSFNGSNTEGWNDLAAGLQFNLIKDDFKKFILSTGLLYEASQGSSEVFQGNGDGMWHLYLTAGKEFGYDGRNHFVSTLGWHLPNNSNSESESVYFSFHYDRELRDGFYFLWETNGIHYTQSGKRSVATVEGGDWLNLGANVADNNFASTAWGFAYKLNSCTELAAAYEVPITGREDLMDNRTTVTFSISY